MLVSYNWLNKYFDGKLPEPEKVAEALTFHAWEIEETSKIGSDTTFDIKILPDKAMWGLSHRGVAKDLSVILDLQLVGDPLVKNSSLETNTGVGINLETETCRRFAAAKISGVKVGLSPEWLKGALEAVGQRSINNIVDASNYVMFDLGQPSHAFDAALVGEKGFTIRQAKPGDRLTGLDEIEYEFTPDDTLIARTDNDEILSIAGLKGGLHSGISERTSDIIVEVANWDPVAIRKTGQRLKLRTDASSRYENGIVPEMVPFGLEAVVDLILKIAGGEVKGVSEVVKTKTNLEPVRVSLSKINSVLGVSLTEAEVSAIVDKFGWHYETKGEEFTITPPFERTDLRIQEDVVEEIGRIYGYEHVEAVTPEVVPVKEINQRFYYSELVRDTLIAKGFSEIFTSSFRNKDEVKLANAFASDKGYLRSTLTTNMAEASAKNAPNADLLGLRQIRLFEIGTVFTGEGEKLMLALGVQSPSGYKAKTDDPMILEAIDALSEALVVKIEAAAKDGIIEIDFGALLEQLPAVNAYSDAAPVLDVTYKPFSNYPAIARDIAMWVEEGISAKEIEDLLNEKAGELRVRTTLFDEFQKNGKISYAFRLVFQSNEKTLTDNEVNVIMDGVYQAARDRGFEVR